MRKLDREEIRIYNAFSKISVDTDNLKRRVLDMENKKVRKPRIKLAAVAAIVAILVGISAAAYTAIGGLDGIIARFNPAFGHLASETLAYTEDDGIRIELFGAQYFGDSVLLYISLQDLSGQGRITRNIWPDLEIYNEFGALSASGGSGQRLHFDQENGKLYLEMQRLIRYPSGESDALYVVIDAIRYFGESGYAPRIAEGNWRIPLGLDIIKASNIVMDNLNIAARAVVVEYISISPLGVNLRGSHNWSEEDMMHPNTSSIDLRVEFSNRLRNVRPRSSGAGISPDGWFEFNFSFASPIDMDNISAIIVNGTRIPINN